jgi:hypothetical protein
MVIGLQGVEEGFYHHIIPGLIWLLSIFFIFFSVLSNDYFHRFPPFIIYAVHVAGLMTFPLYLLHQVAGNLIIGLLFSFGFSKWFALGFSIIIVLFSSWTVAVHLEPRLQKIIRGKLNSFN